METAEPVVSALAFRLAGENAFDPASLADVSSSLANGRLLWNAPAGSWRVMLFYLHPTQGRDGGLVDLLNPAAVRKYLDLSYEEYYRRFGEHFGSTMDSTYVDHEGDYGHRIAWTPRLFETFSRLKGYDLRKELPLLMYDGGKRTPKVRCDYLDVVSELYYQSFFKQVTDWCEAHRIKISGHVWEETLQMEAAFEGDLQRIMRGWAWPGVDSLWEKGRSPRDFKVAGSVAHFRNTRFTCENQGLQGADSYLDFQKMRLGTNMIATWGVASLIPHAFNYNRRRIEYPPDWFYHQPYWKYFKHYADYARRLSCMNDGGRHVADILVLQPTESAWAHSEPAFNSKSAYIPSEFKNPLDTINTVYTDILNRLARERWDYDVADSYYLGEAAIKDGRLVIGDESYKVLILPPVTTVRRATMRKIQEFSRAGGMVIGVKMLPTASMDEGRADSVIAETARAIFGDGQARPAEGRAFFVREDAAEVVKLLEANLTQDVRVLGGPGENFFYQHRRKKGVDFYWLVNDTDKARDNVVLLREQGKAERWDAADASRSALFYRNTEQGTEVRLHFDPWEAYYVVLTKDDGLPQSLRVVDTNLTDLSIASRDGNGVTLRGKAPLGSGNRFFAELADGDGRSYRANLEVPVSLPVIELTGRWRFHPLNPSLAAPYAFVRADPDDGGVRLGWQKQKLDTADWTWTWLSRERLTVKDWWLAGPFPNEDHRGFTEVYAPEKQVDPKAVYTLADGSKQGWTRFSSPDYVVDLGKALDVPRSRYWVTAYAATTVYSPSKRIAYFRIAADNSAKLWVNGKNLLDWHIHPFYYEMREDFALVRSAELQPGWNEVLLKISKCERVGRYGFLLRVTDANGNNFDDLVFSPDRTPADARASGGTRKAGGALWHRIPVPLSSTAVRLPAFKGPAEIYFNGAALPIGSDRIVRLPRAADGKDDVLALRTRADDIMPDSPEFILGVATMEPGSWTTNGLPYYSGSAAYEREFNLLESYAGKRLVLDCGRVGTAAEVWVNEKRAGVRVWLPYAFDISRLVKPGVNRLKIVVTNTMENARAVENHARKLERIDINGLLGPVSIKPYLEAELKCVAR
jgi:hypothetical protein